MNIAKQLLKVLCVTSLLLLAGCGSGRDIETVQNNVKADMEKSLKEHKLNIAITKVALVEKTSNEYTGFVEYNDGSKGSLTVTFGNGKYIWRVSNP